MSYAIENITSLPFGHIIGGPLVAAIDAQGQAAKATVDFIAEVGFEPPTSVEDPFLDPSENEVPSPLIGEIRTVSFKYKTIDAGTETEVELTVPLLTIIPIPFFAIDEMTIDFMAKITESVTANKKSTSSSLKKGSTHARAGWGPFSAGLKGSLSSKHSSSSSTTSKYQTELTMNINVKASQNDMPAGLAKILEILGGVIKDSRAVVASPPSPP